jgi:hypothetical protein
VTGFLTEVGQKLADRWAALLVVPGLLYLAAVTAAAVLGQGQAVSYPVLDRKITDWADGPALKSTGGTVLVVAAIPAGSWSACGRCPAGTRPPAGWPAGAGTAPSGTRPWPTSPLTRPRYAGRSPGPTGSA